MKSNLQAISHNLEMLEYIAKKLANLCDEVVFLGGCTTGLFITEKMIPDVRYTLDVDCIVDIISLGQYYQFEKKLFRQGFKKSLTEEVICRWFHGNTILDVMPADEKILGFGNRWYKKAIEFSIDYLLPNGLMIKIVSAPYFFATKLEAFKSRGHNDFYASHDFEDIITVLDGRIEAVDEILQSDEELLAYLRRAFAQIISSRSFIGALPGHLIQYGRLAEDRAGMIENKIQAILYQ